MLDAGNRVGDILEALFELQSIGIQRWPPIIGEGTPHRQAIPADCFGLVIGASLQRSFDGTNALHLFLSSFLAW